MSHINDGEILYRYAKPTAFPEDQVDIPACVFNDSDLSCDWAALQTTPEASVHVTHGKTVIIEISVCDAIRNPRNPRNAGAAEAAWKQEILHDPLDAIPDDVFTPNQAHSVIRGKKKAGVTDAIRAASKIRT